MKKHVAALLLVLVLLLSITVSALAALPVDETQQYSFVLTNPEQGQDVKVAVGETFTVEFRLTRTDIDENETYDLYIMQNEVQYNAEILELVGDPKWVSSDFNGSQISLLDTRNGTDYRILINSGLNGSGAYPAHMIVAEMTFRAIKEAQTTVTNVKSAMSNFLATAVYASTVTDLSVTIEASGDPDPDSDPESEPYAITLTQPTGGTISTSPAAEATAGTFVGLSAAPDSGYTFGQWRVTASDGSPVAVSGTGLVTGAGFTMPGSAVTVTATMNVRLSPVDPDAPSNPGSPTGTGGGALPVNEISIEDDETPLTAPDVPRFDDVGKTHWAYPHIEYLAELGFVNGKTENMFYPGDSITRAEFVTILARMSGEPLPEYDGTFTDVSGSAYYAQAVAWARKSGVTLGTSPTTFSPDHKITRQDIAVMIVRYTAYKGYVFAQANAPATFTDANSISDYASDAVLKMQRAGVINGYEDGRFGPLGNATRAEASKMLALVHNAMFPNLVIN